MADSQSPYQECGTLALSILRSCGRLSTPRPLRPLHCHPAAIPGSNLPPCCWRSHPAEGADHIPELPDLLHFSGCRLIICWAPQRFFFQPNSGVGGGGSSIAFSIRRTKAPDLIWLRLQTPSVLKIRPRSSPSCTANKSWLTFYVPTHRLTTLKCFEWSRFDCAVDGHAPHY